MIMDELIAALQCEISDINGWCVGEQEAKGWRRWWLNSASRWPSLTPTAESEMALAAHFMLQLAINSSMLGHKCQGTSSSHTMPCMHDAWRCNYAYCIRVLSLYVYVCIFASPKSFSSILIRCFKYPRLAWCNPIQTVLGWSAGFVFLFGLKIPWRSVKKRCLVWSWRIGVAMNDLGFSNSWILMDY